MKYYMNYLWFVIIYLISPEIFAGVFDVIPTDKSKEYLGIIFGGSVGAVSLGGSANPMLSIMFERFNFIIVTAGVVILSYVGIISAINTAREGETMGKKFSLWVPLRGLFGMLLMLPSPGTGYSLVQMTVIWIVLNGIGAANTVWNTVLDQMARGLKAVGHIELPIIKANLDLAAKGILVSATCMAKLNSLSQLDLIKNYGPVGVHVDLYPYMVDDYNKPTNLVKSARIKVGVAPSSKSPPAGALDICGSILVSATIFNNNSRSGDAFNVASIEQSLQIKLNAVLAMYETLSPTANALAACPPTEPCVDNLNKGYINAAEAAYKAQMVNLAGGVRSPLGGAAYGSGTGPRLVPTPTEDNQPPKPPEEGGGGGGGDDGLPKTEYEKALDAYKGAKKTTDVIHSQVETGYESATNKSTYTNLWEKGPAPVAITSNQTNALKVFGWIHAGSYYYTLSQQTMDDYGPNATTVPTIDGTPQPYSGSFTGPQPPTSAPTNWSNELYAQLITNANRQNFNDALIWAQTAGADVNYTSGSLPALGSGTASTGNAFLDQIVSSIGNGMREPILNFMQSQLTEQTEDPLVSMGRFGWKLMITGESLIFAAIAASAGIMLGISAGSCLNPLPWAGDTLFSQVFLVLYGVIIMLWGSGAILGVYLPLVPYIVFTITAFGWMIAVVEAVVGAPLIALALIQPSGEELGQIKAGLGIIATIFLKPVLMIFGFILAGSLLKAGLTMLNFGFVKAINQSVLPTVFNVVVTLAMLVAIDTLFVNKAFELIHLLPSKILRFMGLTPEEGGEKELVGKAKEGFDSGSKAAHDTLKGAGDKTQQLAKADKEKQAAGGDLPKGSPDGKSGGKTPGGKDGKSAPNPSKGKETE